MASNVRCSLLCMCTKEEGNLWQLGDDIFSNMKQTSDRTFRMLRKQTENRIQSLKARPQLYTFSSKAPPSRSSTVSRPVLGYKYSKMSLPEIFHKQTVVIFITHVRAVTVEEDGDDLVTFCHHSHGGKLRNLLKDECSSPL